MIENGTKTEEYRDIDSYWAKRLMHCYDKLECLTAYGRPECTHASLFRPTCFDPRNCKCLREPSTVEFSLGYPLSGDTTRRMLFEIQDITIGIGKPEWGAPPATRVFIIKLGRRLELS